MSLPKHNFSPGPSHLALEILNQAAEAVLEYKNLGISILELSHRSDEFEEILQKAKTLVKELMGLDNHYEVLFLQGGASLQFAMIPLSFLDTVAGYIDTGLWASKAIEEAKRVGEVKIIASSKDQNYAFIPKKYETPLGLDYLHFTSNNTIYGTQFHEVPSYEGHLVSDMTSDIFSKKIEFTKFSLIYAGTQKNMGIAGLSLVVIRKDFLDKISFQKKIPLYLDYKAHIKEKNLFNTPNVFGIYLSMLSLKWIKSKGLKIIEAQNKEKAQLLYSEIDRNSFFESVVSKEDRSRMSIVFKFSNKNWKEKLSEKFEQMCKEAHIVGIAGHRSVGGYRASIYNFVEKESVEILVKVLREFERKYGL